MALLAMTLVPLLQSWLARAAEEVVPALSSMARHSEGERGLRMLEVSEESEWRRQRGMREKKGWSRAERVAGRTHQEAGGAAK